AQLVATGVPLTRRVPGSRPHLPARCRRAPPSRRHRPAPGIHTRSLPDALPICAEDRVHIQRPPERHQLELITRGGGEPQHRTAPHGPGTRLTPGTGATRTRHVGCRSPGGRAYGPADLIARGLARAVADLREAAR